MDEGHYRTFDLIITLLLALVVVAEFRLALTIHQVDTETAQVEAVMTEAQARIDAYYASLPARERPVVVSSVTEAELAESAPAKSAGSVVTVIPEGQATEDMPSAAAVALARTMWGECRGCSTTEQAAVAWCVLNRVDDPRFPGDVVAVCDQKNQFDGYSPDYPVESDLLALAEDVLNRWEREKAGESNVGRVLPADYLYFEGDGVHNHFRQEYRSGETWDWSLESPYDEKGVAD